MSIRSSLKLLLPLLVIPLILVIIWFRGGLILGGGEVGIPFYRPGKTLQLVTSVWIEYATGGFTIGWLPKVPVIYLATVFENLNLPPFLYQALIFFVLMVIGVISFYLLTLNLVVHKKHKTTIAIVSSIFYLLNPFSMSQVWGRGIEAQFFAFALLPATILLFHLGFKSKNYLFAVLIALTSGLLGLAFGLLTFIIVYWLVLFTYLLYEIFTSENKVSQALFGIKFIFITFIFWCLINAWWLAPLFSSYGGAYASGITAFEENLGTLLGVSRNFTPDIIIRLLQRTYFYDPSAFSPVYVSLPFQLISWLPFVFVIYGLYRVLRHKLGQFRFFVVLLVLGLVVSLGANPPFGWLFVEVFKKITVLQAFRNPFEKFGLVYAFGYSAIFAYGLVSFFETKRIKWYGLGVVLFLTCVIFAWPMWTGRVVAGPDRKIGLNVPVYYRQLNDWLYDKSEDYRLFMTPFWGGDGAFYNWSGGGRYQGSDPMLYILDAPTISNTQQAFPYYDFAISLRKYMESMNLAPALALLRTKFLVDRKDAIFITEQEKDHFKFLTSTSYPPQDIADNLKNICQNLQADSKTNGVAWIVCKLPPKDGNLSGIKYLHLRVKTDLPATLEVAVRDSKEVRIRWDGRMDKEYQTQTTDWEDLIFPISAPTEYNSSIDFSKATLIEVMAHPKDLPQLSVGEIEVSGVKLDPGAETPINEFKKVGEFGNLVVYKPVNFNSPPEFGSLSQVEQVKNFAELFNRAHQKRDLINTYGFILPSQNPNKDLGKLENESSIKVLKKHKISNTRYWLEVERNRGLGLILLSKTFNPNWKLLEGVGKEMLNSHFLNDLNLLKKISLDENNHYVVNGYANLWKVDRDGEYAIVFMPQIIADIGWKISIGSVLFLLVALSLWTINEYLSLR